MNARIWNWLREPKHRPAIFVTVVILGTWLNYRFDLGFTDIGDNVSVVVIAFVIMLAMVYDLWSRKQ